MTTTTWLGTQLSRQRKRSDAHRILQSKGLRGTRKGGRSCWNCEFLLWPAIVVTSWPGHPASQPSGWGLHSVSKLQNFCIERKESSLTMTMDGQQCGISTFHKIQISNSGLLDSPSLYTSTRAIVSINSWPIVDQDQVNREFSSCTFFMCVLLWHVDKWTDYGRTQLFWGHKKVR